MPRLLLGILLGFLLPQVLDAQSVKRLEIVPAARTLHGPNKKQQLAVIAHFSNGTRRDVTHLTLFTSSDPDVATVNSRGLVTFSRTGEAAIQCRFSTLNSVRLTYVDPQPDFRWNNPTENNLVDQLIFSKQRELGLLPAPPCSDVVFLRRAYLDLCGILPSPDETRRFVESTRPNKRGLLIDELLMRPEHADLWAHHWASALDLGFQQAPRRGADYLKWMSTQLARDAPLDRLAREIIAGRERVVAPGPVSLYTDAYDAAEAAARISEAFLGVRLQCARCHAHPHSSWGPMDWHRYAAFFAQIQRKSFRIGNAVVWKSAFDSTGEWVHPESKKPVAPRFPGGDFPKLKPGQDRREVLAEWLTAPTNRYFARTLVNRIWLHLLGRGLADPPETLHEFGPLVNEALLDALANELIAQRFDGKQVIRVIMNSQVYQLGTQSNKFNKDDTRYFARGYTRRLRPEVFLDVLTRFFGSPAPIDGMPLGTRAVQVLHAPPSIYFLAISRPPRLTECDRERVRQVASLEHLLNDAAMQARLAVPTNRIGRRLAQNWNDKKMLDEVFLIAFSRLPTEAYYKKATDHLAKQKDRRRAWEDIYWAILNTKEFQYRP